MFTTPCFIRKNTPELRKKLEELGYRYCSTFDEKAPYLWLGEGVIYDTFNIGITIIAVGEYLGPYGISCGSNEELFIALASMTDDEYGLCDYYIVTDDCYPAYEKGSIHRCLPLQSSIHPSCYRKATVEELIEHFKEE